MNLATLGAECGNPVHDLSFRSTFIVAQRYDKSMVMQAQMHSLNVPSFQ